MSDQLHIIIDTREQRPWAFPAHLVVASRGTLHTGDYALYGDTLFAIERKSMDDFVQSVVKHWDRFQREIDRMQSWTAKVIIVEGSLLDIVEQRYNSGVAPALVCKRVAQLTVMGVSVLFCHDAEMAAAMAYKILKERATGI